MVPCVIGACGIWLVLLVDHAASAETLLENILIGARVDFSGFDVLRARSIAVTYFNLVALGASRVVEVFLHNPGPNHRLGPVDRSRRGEKSGVVAFGPVG
jgi:hypothetical protein